MAEEKKTAAKKTTKKTTNKKKKSEKQKNHTLVIVESPTKAKNFQHYLGSGYTVKACMGHLIDLPKSRIAIDTENNFQPEYITVRGKAKLLKELQKEAKSATTIMLASDPDREGEAIAWHLNNALKDKTDAKIVRVRFHDTTAATIKEAVNNPQEIDEAMVDAQKARRILDRLVGYNLSPILWKKVKNGLSAGRVQSVALKLICEREEEVENFIPEEYWTLDADFVTGKSKFTAQLVRYKGEKAELKSESAVNQIIEEINSNKCIVKEIKETEKSVSPKPPFTTSKLQQAAANRLGFTSRKTMQIAQQLYEGINIGANPVGLITYMRTDSVRISQNAMDDVREWLSKNYPDQLPEQPVIYNVEKDAQDAHECIRPTYTSYTPDSIKEYLTRDQYKLYALIWEKFVSSQMKSAKTVTTSADIQAGEAIFRINASRIRDKGFYSVIKTLSSKEENSGSIPVLKMGEELNREKFHPEQHFTQGPARYNDGSIIKVLDEKKLGRPATYAPTINTLLDRYYVSKSNKQLVPTILGKMVYKILDESFPQVINEEFTADLEAQLDEVSHGNLKWTKMLGDFWPDFKKLVDEVMVKQESFKGSLDEVTDQICEKCGKPLVKKLGRFGYFLACSGFPECHNTKSIPLAKCPMPGCTGDIVARKNKGRGKEFFGCTNYPVCNFITHFKPIEVNCPKCGWFLVEKNDKKNGSYKSCINPDCDFLHSADEEISQSDLDNFAKSNQENK